MANRNHPVAADAYSGAFALIRRSAELSEDALYRYILWRWWSTNGGGNFVAFIGLNPSTADGEKDDATIRRCIAFAQDWGFDGLCMLNLFAYRATNPREMLDAADPIGPENDKWLVAGTEYASTVVCMWGTHGTHLGRAKFVKALIPNLSHLGRRTANMQPGHLLYFPKTLRPVRWT